MQKWIVRPQIKNNAKVRLFCFPYAGSSAVVTYKFLVDSLPEDIEVCPVEFPGRGGRMAEKLISDISIAVDQISEEITDYFEKPYIFFGHSMGALVAYELSHLLIKKYDSRPLKLYLSAHMAPNIRKDEKIMHLLTGDEFLDELIKMNGLATEILQHKELLDLMLPIIKNDYKLCETYQYADKERLNIPFQVFGGKEDKDVKFDHLEEWSNLTSSECNIEMLDGDHFFISKQKDLFLEKFSSILLHDLKRHL